ncbi:MAG: M48 family metalloprotease [Acidobacteria bacterium]|nr:M48 family metalloprotease [Acidobacteriota bacterium]
MTSLKRRFAIFTGIRNAAAVLLLAALWLPAATERKEIKPGFNLFSKEQDIALGKEAAAEIEKEVQIVNDKELTAYIEKIGNKLVKVSPDPSYPFSFKVVADDSINAFALPGGPTFIQTGLIKAADNEAQVAGVMGHELGHVVLRHSTNQASKQSMFQLPAMLASGVLGQKGGMLGALGQLGLSFGLNSAMMSYSRKAEHDADIVGARMLAAAGYSPIEMANFFQKLEAEGGSRAPQFFSSHPNPGNRVQYVTEEISGYRQSTDYITNTPEFAKMKARAESIRPSKSAATNPATTNQGGGQTSSGSSSGGASSSGSASGSGVVNGIYSGDGYAFKPPSGWQARPAQQGGGMSALPSNGVVGQSIARGILVDFAAADGANLQRSTDRLIQTLQQQNQGLAPLDGMRQGITLDGTPGESVFLEGQSAVGGEREYVWLVTALNPKGLFYMAMISPASEYQSLRGQYEEAVRSLTFTSAR